jgi:hypothetical protein
MTIRDLATRLGPTLTPDPRRVIIKFFVPGEDAALTRTRAAALIDCIMLLGEDQTTEMLQETLQRFGNRHHDLETTFAHHHDLVRHRVPRDLELFPTARLLVGAYFTHEYAVEGAAVCNPSMVPHPDQSGLRPGQLRVAISLRQIGEGHLSSIGFATALLGPGSELAIADRSGTLSVGCRFRTRRRRDLLAAGLCDGVWDNEVTAAVLQSLPERFDDNDFEHAIARLPADLLTRTSRLRREAHPLTPDHQRRPAPLRDHSHAARRPSTKAWRSSHDRSEDGRWRCAAPTARPSGSRPSTGTTPGNHLDADQHGQARGFTRRHLGQVEDEQLRTVAQGLQQLPAKRCAGEDVDLAGQVDGGGGRCTGAAKGTGPPRRCLSSTPAPTPRWRG